MSSDDGIDYHKSLQHHHHHHHQTVTIPHPSSHIQPLTLPSVTPTPSSASSTSSSAYSLSPHNSSNAISHQIQQQQQQQQQTQSSQVSLGNGTISRRKSSLSYQHQLQQASEVASASCHTVDSIGGSGGNLSISTNTSTTSGVGTGSCSSGSSNNGNKNVFNNTVSPNRYGTHQPTSDEYHHISGRLSLHPVDRFDDTITCCLPPPSPAPTSDRFVMGVPPTNSSLSTVAVANAINTHHYSDQPTQSSVTNSSQKYSNGSSSLHRTMSPNSRFRMSDRFRDVSAKCDRFVTTTHFLANSTPLVSSDTYAYLSSTVHTPVKRYVPTPPPPTEIYSDIPQSSSSTSSSSGYHTIGNSQHLSNHQQQSNQQQQHHQNMNTIPYRFRMKCCLTEQSMSSTISAGQIAHPDRATVTDHYATPPRVRPLKCLSNSGQNQSVSCTAMSIPSIQSQQQQQQQQQISNTVLIPQNMRHNEYMPRTPSVEYLGASGGRVITPVNVVGESSGATCLHCNTMRRTTGVHQTTQTTGPISPTPQQQNFSLTTTVLSNVGHSQADMSSNDLNTTSPTPSGINQTQSSPISPLHQQHDQNKTEQIACSSHHQIQQQQQQQTPQAAVLSSQSALVSRTYQQHQHNHNSSSSSNSSSRHHHNLSMSNNNNATNNNNGNIICTTPQRSALTIRQQMQQRLSRKQRLKEYIRREVAKFFGVDAQSEEDERIKWNERQKRFALRRFGPLKDDIYFGNGNNNQHSQQPAGDRPDILPAQSTDETHHHHHHHMNYYDSENHLHVPIEKKPSVPTMIFSGLSYIIQTINKKQPRIRKQWSRSFAPAHVNAVNSDNPGDLCEGLSALQEDEVFFDSPGNDISNSNNSNVGPNNGVNGHPVCSSNNSVIDHPRQIYMGERVHGWRTSASMEQHQVQQHCGSNSVLGGIGMHQRIGYRGKRISSQLLDGVLDNSRRPIARKVKLLRYNEFDDRNDYRPYFTYWINTVQILVLTLSIICYGIGPIGFGIEHKSGQVLVTSLSLQTVQYQEQRNVWIGPRSNDLVHLGAKFAPCMRRDVKIMDVISKTRRQERETACCIRNDDSGCVQSSQADCSIRGLWPTKSISTWKKWSPGESGPGGRISGSVCGLDPKYCDAPASVAPYEWPDDITKWPICRKTNSFSQRFRFKDHTAEHMVCEVIGHPCCTGVIGECRITTREYCDFINGYFHDEASLCSQVSCLNNVCGMFPFLSLEVPDQFYRLFTSLCLHAGILHLAITIAFQHIFLADLERLMGPVRTAIVYIGSGLAGNLTSAILVPYKPEVGPLASLGGVISSLLVLLLLIHWKQLKKPHLALIKLILITGTLFGMGTLPWQQHFAGLIAGIFCGIILTIALVPFVSLTKYGRKTKINLIWTCMLFYLFMYTIMFVIFYMFPTELMSLGFGNVLNNGMDSDGFDNTVIEGAHSLNNIHLNNLHSGINNQQHQQSSSQHHHHHSDDIIINSSKDGHGMTRKSIDQAVRIKNGAISSSDITDYNYKFNGLDPPPEEHLQNEQFQLRMQQLQQQPLGQEIQSQLQQFEKQQQSLIQEWHKHNVHISKNGPNDGGNNHNNKNSMMIRSCDKGTSCFTSSSSSGSSSLPSSLSSSSSKMNANSGSSNNNNIAAEISNSLSISENGLRIGNLLSDNEDSNEHLIDSASSSDHNQRLSNIDGSGGTDLRHIINNINKNNINGNDNKININNLNNNDNDDVISEGVLSVSNAINQRLITA